VNTLRKYIVKRCIENADVHFKGDISMAKKKITNLYMMEKNISEAQNELNKILELISDKDIKDERIKGLFEHAYHHLNFAWNTRNISKEMCMKVTMADLNEWSKFPEDIDTSWKGE
jgi:hypothetical protein